MDIVHEEWRAVGGKAAGWNYKVSTAGRVQSQSGKMLNQYFERGYAYVFLFNNGHRKKYRTHRLVAQTFLEVLPNCEVNHKDGNTRNNAVENLEWCSHRENMLHARKMHGPTIKKGGTRPLAVDLEIIRARLRGESNDAVSRRLGVQVQTVEKVFRAAKQYAEVINSHQKTGG